MGGTFTHRLGVTANDTPEDLSDLFANGEIGDWWRFDSDNTTDNGTGFGGRSSAIGMVNGLVLSAASSFPQNPPIATVNGTECLSFAGNSRLAYNFGSTVAQPGTIIICMGANTANTEAYVSGSGATLRWQLSNDSTDDIIIVSASTSLDTTLNAPSGIGSPGRVLTAEFNGASSKFRRDGVQTATGNAGTGGTNQLTIGALWDGTFDATMWAWSALFIDRLLTSDETDRVEQLFASHAALSW